MTRRKKPFGIDAHNRQSLHRIYDGVFAYARCGDCGQTLRAVVVDDTGTMGLEGLLPRPPLGELTLVGICCNRYRALELCAATAAYRAYRSKMKVQAIPVSAWFPQRP